MLKLRKICINSKGLLLKTTKNVIIYSVLQDKCSGYHGDLYFEVPLKVIMIGL